MCNPCQRKTSTIGDPQGTHTIATVSSNSNVGENGGKIPDILASKESTDVNSPIFSLKANSHSDEKSVCIASDNESKFGKDIAVNTVNKINSHDFEAAVAGANQNIDKVSEEETIVALKAMQDAAALINMDTNESIPKASNESKERKKEENQSQLSRNSDHTSVTTPKGTKRKRTVHRHVSWQERIRQLKAYKEEHGDLCIPIRFKENPSLGKFVHNTREQYKLYHKKSAPGKKKCSLTAERVQQLEDLGFVWSTERSKHQKEDWQARLEQLREYKTKHGDCLVPHGYTGDPSFAEWIHRQRTTYAHMLKEEHPGPVVQERMNQLEQLGFHFTVHADKWVEHLSELKQYKAIHGNCNVPTHYVENPQLGRWVHTQRHQRRLQIKGKKSCMTDERVALLDELDFCWEIRPKLERPKATWEQRFAEVKRFNGEYQHYHIPETTMPHLYSWCVQQKQRLRALEKSHDYDHPKHLGPDRIAALAAIGFTKDVDLGDGDGHSDASPTHPYDDHHDGHGTGKLSPTDFHDHHEHKHCMDVIVEPMALAKSHDRSSRSGECTFKLTKQKKNSDTGRMSHGMAMVWSSLQ